MIQYVILHSFHVFLLCAEFLLIKSFLPRKNVWLRVALFGGLYLILPYLGLYDLAFLKLFGWLDISYLIMFAASLVVLWLCFCFEPPELLFVGIAGYVIQHLAEKLTVVCLYLNYIFFPNQANGYYDLYCIFVLIINAVVLAACYFLFAQRFTRAHMARIKQGQVIFVFLGVIIVVYILNLLAAFVNYEVFIAQLLINCYSIVGCLTLLALQFQMALSGGLEGRNHIIEQLLIAEKQQHAIAQSNIEVINKKCHDLRHQIAVLRSMNNNAERDRNIAEIEAAIAKYDSIANTGNHTLDIVLMEKHLLCVESNIRLNCMVDGSKLDFMEISDICSLFGNALENAINAVKLIKDVDKRLIIFNMYEKNDLLSIHIENFFEHAFEMENGIPKTTNEDKAYHGFGIQSMEYIINKYDGTMSISAKDNIFSLDILLPLQR